MSSLWSTLRNAAYGLLMGGADVIPGVSGGTMALIVGVYEALVSAISSLVAMGLAVVRLDGDAVRQHWRAVPWGLVLPLGVGLLAAIRVGALVIPGLMETYPHQMRGLFLGLVAASLVIPALRIERFRAAHAVLVIVFALAAFLLTGLPVLEASTPSLARVFGSAAVAICAMILPGVSGAFLLEALGIYTPTLEAVNAQDWTYILTFVGGAAAGLGAFATLLDWLLTRHHDATMAALLGLIAGALRALWPYGGAERTLRLPTAEEPVASVVALALVGLGAVLALTVWGHRARRPSTPAA